MNKEIKTRKVPFICNEGKPLTAVKSGRNELCKCGSGLKSKKCHGNDTRYYLKK